MRIEYYLNNEINAIMKKILILLISFIVLNVSARETNDSINVAGISGSDTVIVISKSFLNWGKKFTIEIEYSDLNQDDATFDLGTRLEIDGGTYESIGDSTFNSFGDILGVSLPYTLDATTNADSYYGKASVLIWHPDPSGGKEILFKIDPGTVSSGYIRYKILY